MEITSFILSVINCGILLLLIYRFSGRHYQKKIQDEIDKNAQAFIRQINKTTHESIEVMTSNIDALEIKIKELHRMLGVFDKSSTPSSTHNSNEILPELLIPMDEDEFEKKYSPKNPYEFALFLLKKGAHKDLVAQKTLLSINEIELLQELHLK